MIGIPITVRTMAEWVGRGVVCVGDATALLRHLCIDSRVTKAGALFVALPGERTDGHRYLAEALAPVGSAALICRDHYRTHRAALHALVADGRRRALLVVRDPLTALLRIARAYLERLAPPCKIAITGSSGKTTTKELLAAILRAGTQDLYYSTANRNSAIGVPLSILELTRAPQYMLVEAGTGWRGEIGRIARALNPHIALITNIGHAHIAAFGSRAAIAREKLALAYQSNALRALYIHSRARHFVRRRLPALHIYDTDPFARRISYRVDAHGIGASATIDGHTVDTQLYGTFQRDNLSAAAVLAHHLDVPAAQIAAGLSAYRPLFGRMQYIEAQGVTFVFDCYNSNPESAAAALSYLREVPRGEGRKIAILGGMHELGRQSARFHVQLVEQAIASGADCLICIGDEFAARDVARHPAGYHFPDAERAIAEVREFVRPGDLVLLKGSRGVALERLMSQLQPQQQGVRG